MSIIPTVRVMRPDGKGYHLVNADVSPAPEVELSAELDGSGAELPPTSNEVREAPAKPKPARKPRRKAKGKK